MGVGIFLICLIFVIAGLTLAWIFYFERKLKKDMKVINKADKDADKKWRL